MRDDVNGYSVWYDDGHSDSITFLTPLTHTAQRDCRASYSFGGW